MKGGYCLQITEYRLLTCDSERDHLADDAAHTVPGDALVAPRILPADGLDLVEMFGRELGDEVSILEPSILGLGKSCKQTMVHK